MPWLDSLDLPWTPCGHPHHPCWFISACSLDQMPTPGNPGAARHTQSVSARTALILSPDRSRPPAAGLTGLYRCEAAAEVGTTIRAVRPKGNALSAACSIGSAAPLRGEPQQPGGRSESLPKKSGAPAPPLEKREKSPRSRRGAAGLPRIGNALAAPFSQRPAACCCHLTPNLQRLATERVGPGLGWPQGSRLGFAEALALSPQAHQHSGDSPSAVVDPAPATGRRGCNVVPRP